MAFSCPGNRIHIPAARIHRHPAARLLCLPGRLGRCSLGFVYRGI